MPEREGEFFNKHQTTALEKLVYIECLNPERGGEFFNKHQATALEEPSPYPSRLLYVA
jgi:hypothetical protein